MNRVPIPQKIVSELLVANRHACCVCQTKGVQIHHIDENASNNDFSNLAALCLDCHDRATMTAGLTKKLRAPEVSKFKEQWESKCAADIEALSRDRVRFYATAYKNPPRIRELFSRLSVSQRESAAQTMLQQLEEDTEAQEKDKGYQWQAVPKNDDLTRVLLMSIHLGDLWPRCLERVKGHELDPDYPIELGPPHGMQAFHGFDLYCQLMVRALSNCFPPRTLESLWALKSEELIDHFSGSLVSFRETAIGKSVLPPSCWKEAPLGRVQFRVQRSGFVYRALMPIKNMYVFSDTASINLERSKVCGVAILEDAQLVQQNGKEELQLGLKPLIIGIGGLGQSEEGLWNIPRGVNGSKEL
ncbi:MAG: HNH endonuclease signature motif containing protein [Gammaproteobacteria bacterium]